MANKYDLSSLKLFLMHSFTIKKEFALCSVEALTSEYGATASSNRMLGLRPVSAYSSDDSELPRDTSSSSSYVSSSSSVSPVSSS